MRTAKGLLHAGLSLCEGETKRYRRKEDFSRREEVPFRAFPPRRQEGRRFRPGDHWSQCHGASPYRVFTTRLREGIQAASRQFGPHTAPDMEESGTGPQDHPEKTRLDQTRGASIARLRTDGKAQRQNSGHLYHRTHQTSLGLRLFNRSSLPRGIISIPHEGVGFTNHKRHHNG